MANLTATSFDRAAIMKTAWLGAKAEFEDYARRFAKAEADHAKAGVPFTAKFSKTLRGCLSIHLAAAWLEAKDQRRLARYAPDQRAAVKAAEANLLFANCTDNFQAARAAIAAAGRRLEDARRAT